MKLSKLTLVFLLAAGATAVAEEFPEFVTWMKAIGTANDELRKMEKKTGEDVQKRAEKIAGSYENMIGFWRQRNTTDAVKWSEDGKTFAMQLATAAYANDTEKATAAMKSLGGTCRSCHEAHREKIGEGKYKIK